MKLFTGSITFYDPDTNYLTDYVIVAGETYGDAANTLVDYYGADTVENITLELINPDQPLVAFETNTVPRLVKDEGVIY
jgi:hypothetical protein